MFSCVQRENNKGVHEEMDKRLINPMTVNLYQFMRIEGKKKINHCQFWTYMHHIIPLVSYGNLNYGVINILITSESNPSGFNRGNSTWILSFSLIANHGLRLSNCTMQLPLQPIWLFSRVKTLKKSIKKPWKKLF